MRQVATNAYEIKRLTNSILLARDESEKANLIDSLKSAQRPRILSFLNAHAFNLAWRNTHFRSALSESDYLLRDGVGIKFLLNALARNAGLNLNGTDLIPELLKSMAGQTIQIYGANEHCNDLAGDLAEEWGLTVVARDHGFHDPEYYVERAKAERSDVIVLAMGMPKQELLALQIRESIDYPALIVNGGAVFNIVSGITVRAPYLVRAVGLEWAHRLWLEPQRLWKRYVIGIPVFLLRMAAVAILAGRRAPATFHARTEATTLGRDRNG